MNNRLLETIAIICALALLIEELLLRGQENAPIIGIGVWSSWPGGSVAT